MPRVKRFLKEKGGVDQYPDVKIEWIFHHNPDLNIYEDGKLLQKIDLAKYDYDGLHTLFRSHFRTKVRAPAPPAPHAPHAHTRPVLSPGGDVRRRQGLVS